MWKLLECRGSLRTLGSGPKVFIEAFVTLNQRHYPRRPLPDLTACWEEVCDTLLMAGVAEPTLLDVQTAKCRVGISPI